MSGRLIILPKKSWHPGKRENIEKVLRDERLAAEEAAAARERAREIAQEGIVETLSKKRSAAEIKHAEAKKGQGKVAENRAGQKRKRKGEHNEIRVLGGKGQGWGETPQHVNLFSEAEREAGKLLGQNADHEREKREQELTAQRRSGLAPTALGEGAAELKGKNSQPWYTQVRASSAAPKAVARANRLGREVTGQEAEAVIKRDQGRKGRADPMGTLFRPSPQAAREKSSPRGGGVSSGTMRVVVELKEGALGVSDSSAAETNATVTRAHGKTEAKKRKNVKKRSKKSTKRERTRSRRDGRGGDSAEADDSRNEANRAKDTAREQVLEELRRKRLAREHGERNRETRLLAEREMAGQSLPDERSMAYNNQYNAPAARQNRGN